MEQPQNSISSTTTMTALAGILFFGPIIAKTKDENIQNNPFILWYCKVWALNLALFIITLIIFIFNYLFPSLIFDRIITLTTWAICTISAFSIFACLNNIQLFDTLTSTDTSSQTLKKSPESIFWSPLLHKETIIKSFIPFYNIKLRYQTANFQTPYRRLKESILRRTTFSFLTLFFGTNVGMFIIALIIIRLLLLIMNLDIISNNLKKFLNHGFLLHPEEITGYLTGRIPFLSHLYKPDETETTTNETQTSTTPTTNEAITQAKQNYTNMSASSFNITLQYLSFLGIVWMIHRPLILNYETSILLLAMGFLVGKCLFTYWQYKKLPNIPLLYEGRSILLK